MNELFSPRGICVKRIFDLVLSFIAIMVLLIPGFFLAWLIRQKLGSPVFFVQTRPGLNGKPFRMIKFRSMTGDRTLDGKLLPDAERLTRFGKFLRDTSLDEIPELWNVFMGEMSLVGPRPLLMEYLPLYSKEQARRHEVRPGITGWAQINGRNSLSWDEKFKLDIWYVMHRNIYLDIKILCLTMKIVRSRDGISAEGEVTMPKFNGNKGENHDNQGIEKSLI